MGAGEQHDDCGGCRIHGLASVLSINPSSPGSVPRIGRLLDAHSYCKRRAASIWISIQNGVPQSWDEAIKRAKIKKLSPHSCRHGFAKTMLHNGIVKTIAKLGGWKDAATLLRTYALAMGDRTVTNVLFSANLIQGARSRPVDTEKEQKNGTSDSPSLGRDHPLAGIAERV
jgi:hypothetical protein